MRKILAAFIFLFCGFFSICITITGYTQTVFEIKYPEDFEKPIEIIPESTIEDSTEPSYDFGSIATDYFALKQINEETVGWLNMPNICYYPIMYSGDTKYLHLDVYGNYKYAGSLFMGANSRGSFENMALLYGHHMRDGSMFAGLKLYKNESFFNNNELIEVFDGEYLYKYKVYTILNIVDGKEFINQDPDSEERVNYFKSLYNRSLVKGEEPDYEAQMLFFQTCDYLGYDNCRLVVGSYLVEKIKY